METRNNIIEATYGLFAEKGMTFSLNEVAVMVGIKKPSIYAHFNSKDDLLHHIFDKEVEEYFDVVECKSGTLKDLFFGMLNYFSLSRKKLLFWKRLLLFPPSTLNYEMRQKIIDLSERRFNKVKSLIENTFTDSPRSVEEINVMSVFFLSVIHGLLSSEIIYQNQNIESCFRQEWKLIENLLQKED